MWQRANRSLKMHKLAKTLTSANMHSQLLQRCPKEDCPFQIKFLHCKIQISSNEKSNTGYGKMFYRNQLLNTGFLKVF